MTLSTMTLRGKFSLNGQFVEMSLCNTTLSNTTLGRNLPLCSEAISNHGRHLGAFYIMLHIKYMGQYIRFLVLTAYA